MSSQFDLFGTPEPEREQEPGRVREEQRVILTVSDLTANIRGILENAYSEVWIEAEISNCRLWNTGHLYFTLKDPGAQIKAVMFKSDVRSLKFRPEDGLHVVGTEGRAPGPDPQGRSYSSWASFSDPDGNSWLLQEVKMRLPGRGLGVDVPTLTGLLRETEERHGQYEATAPKHHWSDWYAAYIVARENGLTPDEAANEAALHTQRGMGQS